MACKAEKKDRFMTAFFKAVTLIVFLFVLSFFIYIIFQGRERLSLKFIFSTDQTMFAINGIAPQLFNSLYMVFISMLITIPIGLGAGVYLSEYAKEGRFKNIIRLCIETLSSIPSIVIGLFGFLVFVQNLKMGYSILSGALALSILNIPLMTRISEDAISSVDQTIKEGSLALGATKYQTITKAIIPAALSGIVTGSLLAVGRAFGEAAALIYTSGMTTSCNFSVLNPFNPQSPFNLLRPAETLSVFIWKINSESLLSDTRQIADAATAVLLIMVLLFNLTARLIERHLNRKYQGN